MDDYTKVRQAYGRRSAPLHSSADVLNLPLPTPKDLQKQISELRKWVEEIKQEARPDMLDEIIGKSWLDCHAPELKGLSDELVMSIIRFTFLWMIFEGKALKGRKEGTNGERIVAVSNQWANSDHSKAKIFSDALKYFQERYIDPESKKPNNKFKVLFGVKQDPAERGRHRSRRRESPRGRVKRVLLNKKSPQINEIVPAMLIIVYHYRNRLFHGPKWLEDDLPNQPQNFAYANDLLRCAIELNQQQLDLKKGK